MSSLLNPRKLPAIGSLVVRKTFSLPELSPDQQNIIDKHSSLIYTVEFQTEIDQILNFYLNDGDNEINSLKALFQILMNDNLEILEFLIKHNKNRFFKIKFEYCDSPIQKYLNIKESLNSDGTIFINNILSMACNYSSIDTFKMLIIRLLQKPLPENNFEILQKAYYSTIDKYLRGEDAILNYYHELTSNLKSRNKELYKKIINICKVKIIAHLPINEIKKLVKFGLDLTPDPTMNFHPLYAAMHNKEFPKVFDYIINYNPDIDVNYKCQKLNYGLPTLLLYADFCDSNERLKMLKILCDKGANIQNILDVELIKSEIFGEENLESQKPVIISMQDVNFYLKHFSYRKLLYCMTNNFDLDFWKFIFKNSTKKSIVINAIINHIALCYNEKESLEILNTLISSYKIELSDIAKILFSSICYNRSIVSSVLFKYIAKVYNKSLLLKEISNKDEYINIYNLLLISRNREACIIYKNILNDVDKILASSLNLKYANFVSEEYASKIEKKTINLEASKRTKEYLEYIFGEYPEEKLSEMYELNIYPFLATIDSFDYYSFCWFIKHTKEKYKPVIINKTVEEITTITPEFISKKHVFFKEAIPIEKNLNRFYDYFSYLFSNGSDKNKLDLFEFINKNSAEIFIYNEKLFVFILKNELNLGNCSIFNFAIENLNICKKNFIELIFTIFTTEIHSSSDHEAKINLNLEIKINQKIIDFIKSINTSVFKEDLLDEIKQELYKIGSTNGILFCKIIYECLDKSILFTNNLSTELIDIYTEYGAGKFIANLLDYSYTKFNEFTDEAKISMYFLIPDSKNILDGNYLEYAFLNTLSLDHYTTEHPIFDIYFQYGIEPDEVIKKYLRNKFEGASIEIIRKVLKFIEEKDIPKFRKGLIKVFHKKIHMLEEIFQMKLTPLKSSPLKKDSSIETSKLEHIESDEISSSDDELSSLIEPKHSDELLSKPPPTKNASIIESISSLSLEKENSLLSKNPSNRHSPNSEKSDKLNNSKDKKGTVKIPPSSNIIENSRTILTYSYKGETVIIKENHNNLILLGDEYMYWNDDELSEKKFKNHASKTELYKKFFESNIVGPRAQNGFKKFTLVTRKQNMFTKRESEQSTLPQKQSVDVCELKIMNSSLPRIIAKKTKALLHDGRETLVWNFIDVIYK